MNNKVVAFLLAVPFVIVAGWMMYYTSFTHRAQEVVLPIQGYDPRNFLSGHYILFQIDWEHADCHQADWNGNCPRTAFTDINRFYVPENQAHSLERSIQSAHTRAKIVFAYQPGQRPVAKTLLLNGKPAF